MSGWIKWEKDIETDPRFLRMMRSLRVTHERDTSVTHAFPLVTVVVGALIRFWSYADSHIRENDTLDLGAEEIDDLVGVKGFAAAMPEDWLRIINEHTVELPGYQEHNGVEAKKRDLAAKRQERKRARSRNAEVTQERDAGVTGALPDQTRPDQTKEGDVPQELNGHASKSPTDAVIRVFDHWRKTWDHARAQLDAKRRKVIRAALESYSEADLLTCISGYRKSPHHRGQNERRTVYDDIELFLRDAKHIDAGLKFAKQGGDEWVQ
jgi:hypothetical protein